MPRNRTRFSRRAGIGVAALAALAPLALAAPAAAGGFTSDRSVIQVVTTLLGGKNVFVPSTIVVVGGQETTLSIFNTTDTPHGFRIPALGIEAILPNGEETEVVLPKLEGNQVLRIDCHLHPPHRTATLVVLPGKDED